LLRLCYQARGIDIHGWRQYQYLYQALRNLYLKAMRLRPSNAKNKEKVELREQAIRDAYQAFLARCQDLLIRIRETLAALTALDQNPLAMELKTEMEKFLPHADRQIDQIHRRVILGETIPHQEKVFSVFEPYSEWISKGKAGVPVELGLRVAIVEDQYGFILHHRVMTGEVDVQVPVDMIQHTQSIFPTLRACSFDKGFYSKENLVALDELLDVLVLPRKGRWTEKDRERETAPAFVAMRRQHSAVESALNALEVHGLDRCLDHGLDGFKRYVAWAIVGRNLLKLEA
jgi:IS5 family transposase